MTKPLPTAALLLLLATLATATAQTAPEPDRSPIALALSRDGTRLLTANQGSDSVSLLDTTARKVLHELSTGPKPSSIALTRDGKQAVVTHWYGADLAVLDLNNDHLTLKGRVAVGPEPRGVVLAPDGKTAYVALGAANEIARVDLDTLTVNGRLAVGREPRGVALSPDASHLLVGNARSQSLSLIDVPNWKVERSQTIDGDNLRQVAFGPDGKGYVVNMKNRGFATTANNIDLGWVLGQRLTRIDPTGPPGFETLSLDPSGHAVADVHGLAIAADGRFLAVSCGGTHEVLLLRADARRLPWRSNGSRDLIAGELLSGDGRFRRVPLGGRPTELAFAPDAHTLYVANTLNNAVQVVDAEVGTLVATIPLGGPETPSLARRGEALFHDATRSSNQWYSCNTCHSDGHTNGLDFDTLNDGWQDLSTAHERSRKKVPTLRRVAHTGPWTWHGWQTSLQDAVVESFTKSMQGPRPNPDEVEAVVAFLQTLDYPPNPNLGPNSELSPEALRGREVFHSPKAACNSCHGGPELTDGRTHETGLGERGERYHGFNPPSLRGVHDKDPYLHDGRAKSLRDALAGPHAADDITGLGTLDDAELDDLVAYLKSL